MVCKPNGAENQLEPTVEPVPRSPLGSLYIQPRTPGTENRPTIITSLN